jgi:hypothetical protein
MILATITTNTVDRCTLRAFRPRSLVGVSRTAVALAKPDGSLDRTIAWLHNFRRLRGRFERLALFHEAFMKIVTCIICWRQLQLSLC